MASSSDEWSVNANEAVQISVVQPGTTRPTSLHQFHPKFTYPIFGEAEQIFGYKGLKLDLRFAAHDLRPSLSISYDKKFPTVGTTAALDLNKTFQTFLPPIAFEQNFDSKLQNDVTSKDWKPPGEMVHSYTRNSQTFEIWAGSLLDPSIRELVDNIQIMILFYIEGGQFINLEDVDWTLDRWRVYFIYQKHSLPPMANASVYTFMGYATTYRFYRFIVPKPRPTTSSLEPFPPAKQITPKSLSSRLRISQFLILPPYQRGGHGSAVYQAIYSDVMSDPTILEMTVEDPSEEFDKLRDLNDFRHLKPQFDDADININTEPFTNIDRGRIKRVPTSMLLPVEMLQSIRSKNKIAGRQFARQVEMFLLAQIGFSHRAAGGASLTTLKIRGARASNPNDRRYYWWRILLKQRIIKKNKDLLLQLPLEDRAHQIENSALGQEDEYEGLIMLYAVNQEKDRERNGNGVAGGGESSVARKRKVIEEDDDEDSDATSGSKRPKV